MTAETAALEQLRESEATRTEHLDRVGADAERAAQHARDEIAGL